MHRFDHTPDDDHQSPITSAADTTTTSHDQPSTAFTPRHILQLQRTHGNRAVQRLLRGTGQGAVIQRTWQFGMNFARMDATEDVYWWDGVGGPEPSLAPGPARRYKLAKVPGDPGGNFLKMGETQYLTARGGGTSGKGKGSNYNPFGRFNTQLTKAAYIPKGTDPTQYANLGTTLNPNMATNVDEHIQIASFDTDDPVFSFDGYPYPSWVKDGAGTVLNMVALDPIGATYGDGPSIGAIGRAKGGATGKDVPALKELAAQMAKHGSTGAVSAIIDTSVIMAFSGKRGEEDGQIKIMGASAGDMAAAAGYDGAIDPEFAADTTRSGKAKHGYEWLHLISYALGGPKETGPQDPGNLVVGTSAANTAMIMVEDAINNLLTSPTSPVAAVKLVVKPIMENPDYLIAQTIVYQVTFMLRDGRTLPDITLSFDALTTGTPYEATNKYFRAMLKQQLDEVAAPPTPSTGVPETYADMYG